MKVLALIPISYASINLKGKYVLSFVCEVTFRRLFRKPQTKQVTIYYEGQVHNEKINPYLRANGYRSLISHVPTFSDSFNNGFYCHTFSSLEDLEEAKNKIVSGTETFEIALHNLGWSSDYVSTNAEAFKGWKLVKEVQHGSSH